LENIPYGVVIVYIRKHYKKTVKIESLSLPLLWISPSLTQGTFHKKLFIL